MIKYPQVKVKLTGTDGNMLMLAGRVSAAMKKAGLRDEAREFTEQIFKCRSYDEALRLMMSTVDVR